MRVLIIGLISAAIFVSPAAVAKSHNKDCELANKPDVILKYGAGEIWVPAVVRAKAGQGRNFLLVAGKDFRDAKVTIEASGPDQAEKDWLHAEGTYSDDHILRICVPEDKAPGSYKYAVEVEGVGSIDPRFEVEPN